MSRKRETHGCARPHVNIFELLSGERERNAVARYISLSAALDNLDIEREKIETQLDHCRRLLRGFSIELYPQQKQEEA